MKIKEDFPEGVSGSGEITCAKACRGGRMGLLEKKKKVGQCGGNKKIMQEHGVHVGYKVKEGSDHVVRVLRIQTIRGQ